MICFNKRGKNIYGICILLCLFLLFSCGEDQPISRRRIAIVESMPPYITDRVPSSIIKPLPGESYKPRVCNSLNELRAFIPDTVLTLRPDLGQIDFERYSAIVTKLPFRSSLLKIYSRLYKEEGGKYTLYHDLIVGDSYDNGSDRPIYVLHCFVCDKVPTGTKIDYAWSVQELE